MVLAAKFTKLKIILCSQKAIVCANESVFLSRKIKKSSFSVNLNPTQL